MVHHSAFDHLPKLITLNLAHNRIERLESHALRWLPNLLKIELQSNRLTSFSWDSIANCTNPFMAASLNLSDNQISALHVGGPSGDVPFYHRTSVHIKSLDLSHNQLTQLPTAFLDAIAYRSLKKLILRHNRIAALPPDIISVHCQELQVTYTILIR